MSTLQFPRDSRIEAKIEYTPATAVPAGKIELYDYNNVLKCTIRLTRDNIDTWTDVTEHVVHARAGTACAKLLGTVGGDKWQATLCLRARRDGSDEHLTATDELSGQGRIDLAVVFREQD